MVKILFIRSKFGLLPYQISIHKLSFELITDQFKQKGKQTKQNKIRSKKEQIHFAQIVQRTS